jgi:AraC family cel operon transcriptional repressor
MSMTLRWKRLFKEARMAQMSQARKAPGEEFPLHDHDFPEVFWISEGTVEHTINGQQATMTRGELVFVRAPDRHHFLGSQPKGGVISNLAVRADVAAHLRTRYFPDATHAWWTTAGIPSTIRLTAGELHALDQAAREIGATPNPDLLATERFLLNLFHLLRRRETHVQLEAEPAWLAEARGALADPRHLAAGVHKLAQLAGCSAEHLARTVRRVHGMTPTDLVNRQRLDWAAGELMFSTTSITDIAAAAGFESLSHFYHLFRARHGVPPRQFRRRAQPLT